MVEGTAFSCLWSKDPPTKKRKRWSDGTVKLIDNKDGSGALTVVFDELGFRIGSERFKLTNLEKDSEIQVGRLSLQVLETLEEEIEGIADENMSGVENAMGENKSGAVIKSIGPKPLVGRSADLGGSTSRAAMRVVEANCQGLKGTECNNTIATSPSVRNTVIVPSTRFSYPQTSPVARMGPSHFRESLSCTNSLVYQHRDTASPLVRRPDGKFSTNSIKNGAVRKSRNGFSVPRSLAVDEEEDSHEGSTTAPSTSSIDPKDLILEEGPSLTLSLGTSLAKHLKKHQRTGVQFMWKRLKDGGGVILADDMGLGKTLQAIALISACLRHLGGKGVQKAVVVCPSSLVRNWGNEVQKWAGVSLYGRTIVAGKSGQAGAQAAADFNIGSHKRFSLLITSYDLYRSHSKWINKTKGLGLLVCDEAHRLKASSSRGKTILALVSCPARRRLLITGTPIQNNLAELWALAEFAQPGVLGPLPSFRKRFIIPIEEREEDMERAREELGEKLQQFMLRRSKAAAAGDLPNKTDITIFCRLSNSQILLYKKLIGTDEALEALNSSSYCILPIALRLRQLCNHGGGEDDDGTTTTVQFRSEDEDSAVATTRTTLHSSKLILLRALLRQIRKRSESDKVVISSCFTTTLDHIECIAHSEGWQFLRLDGTTMVDERQNLVNQFNSSPPSRSTAEGTAASLPLPHPFLFLLSSKAGGVGLNLVGGNRLVLFDGDWNPGTIEENIFQRSFIKQNLCKVMVDERGITCHGEESKEGMEFCREELRELLTYNEHSRCETFNKLNKRQKGLWSDYNGVHEVKDIPLQQAIREDTEAGALTTFVHSTTQILEK